MFDTKDIPDVLRVLQAFQACGIQQIVPSAAAR